MLRDSVQFYKIVKFKSKRGDEIIVIIIISILVPKVIRQVNILSNILQLQTLQIKIALQYDVTPNSVYSNNSILLEFCRIFDIFVLIIIA